MDYDYDSLVSLAAVIREGGFDAAAKSLEVTQSAVSQRIKQLEEKVGSVLIVRGRPCVRQSLDCNCASMLNKSLCYNTSLVSG